MGYLTDGLTFNTLRGANIARLPTFKNSKGLPAHTEPDGSDWSPAQWLQAIVGELGEYANYRKKFERGDITEDEFKVEAAKELADVQIYMDILAYQLKIDLGKATMDKFNEVSERVGSPVRMGAEDWYYNDVKENHPKAIKGNGLMCPKCSGELHDQPENIVIPITACLISVKCAKCGYSGARSLFNI